MRFEPIEFFNDDWVRDPNGLNFRTFSICEMGKASLIVDRLYLRMNCDRGTMDFTVWADEKFQRGVWNSGPLSTKHDNYLDYIEFVDTRIRQVRIEGRRSAWDTMLSFQWLPLGR